MMERLEEGYCIKFCQKLGDNQVETIWKGMVAFSQDARSRTQIKECYNLFKGGHGPWAKHLLLLLLE